MRRTSERIRLPLHSIICLIASCQLSPAYHPRHLLSPKLHEFFTAAMMIILKLTLWTSPRRTLTFPQRPPSASLSLTLLTCTNCVTAPLDRRIFWTHRVRVEAAGCRTSNDVLLKQATTKIHIQSRRDAKQKLYIQSTIFFKKTRALPFVLLTTISFSTAVVMTWCLKRGWVLLCQQQALRQSVMIECSLVLRVMLWLNQNVNQWIALEVRLR
ncbi:uncharacterized protein MYCFIDRAFT_175096 [Pseudocercospora fijiensis CIRAD86]|uniref:Uncharacterized protein n=1 Tax=Pseudocercospora fijiensis (strain CIRAD86) TaxID=383855 RepID=M2ZXF3_PSEFD|nr:uncharacterized protein MYCFIDRAFT_175096 [Pseudocercospora fijiensis CIRAD86]EME83669.1 hypothetical protein MYCFIDRAFT_175096 [Pseudocercospora fijiensis CIRAD86]